MGQLNNKLKYFNIILVLKIIRHFNAETIRNTAYNYSFLSYSLLGFLRDAQKGQQGRNFLNKFLKNQKRKKN